MTRDPKRQDHPKSVYLIGLMVWLIIIFVLAGVINHLAFSSHGPGLLIPLLQKIQKTESPILAAFKKHKEAEEHCHFHHFVDYPKVPEDRQTTCFICHSNLPHNKTKKIRAMLNMHTSYIACETCHLVEEKGQQVVYRWYSPMEKNPKGPFFGTAYDPETGELKAVVDHFSKITPFYRDNGELKPIVHMLNAPTAKDYVNVRDQLTPEQREGITKRFHVDIRPKGPDCRACHAADGMLNFQQLGFSHKRIVDIEELNIKGLLTKYDEFYLPDLLQQPESTEP